MILLELITSLFIVFCAVYLSQVLSKIKTSHVRIMPQRHSSNNSGSTISELADIYQSDWNLNKNAFLKFYVDLVSI